MKTNAKVNWLTTMKLNRKIDQANKSNGSKNRIYVRIYLIIIDVMNGGGRTWVNICWVCAAGLSEPFKPHYSLFCDQL